MTLYQSFIDVVLSTSIFILIWKLYKMEIRNRNLNETMNDEIRRVREKLRDLENEKN